MVGSGDRNPVTLPLQSERGLPFVDLHFGAP
jgi:hypothetical protein